MCTVFDLLRGGWVWMRETEKHQNDNMHGNVNGGILKFKKLKSIFNNGFKASKMPDCF